MSSDKIKRLSIITIVLLFMGLAAYQSHKRNSTRDATTGATRNKTAQKHEPEISSININIPAKGWYILILKKDRQLYLFKDGELNRQCNIALGFNPIDDKKNKGDGCTPHGTFYICSKNSQSRYFLSLGISYPNKEDAKRGLKSGIISKSEHDKIVAACDTKTKPTWDTALGGEICIHGGGTARDWTLGCIALENSDVKFIFDNVPLTTPVEIRP